MTFENGPEIAGHFESERITDPELLQLRYDLLREELFPNIMADPAFEDYNNWQKATVEQLADGLAQDQTIDLPTRSGKSYLIRQLAAHAYRVGARVAIIAPRRHILNEHQAELRDLDVPCTELPPRHDQDAPFDVRISSAQRIARNDDEEVDDTVDLLLIDEVHRALGDKTLENINRLYPNAVRISFTATPDYTESRSVTDHYGEKLISHSIVEAIRDGKVPPVRAFMYKTNAKIDLLDPGVADFTPRELRRLSSFVSRNKAIVDTAQDLVASGLQGLITTIPGENLLHADILAEQLAKRTVTQPDGTERPIRSRVLRGSDADIDEVLQDFEDGAIDILLYCDLLREGTKLKSARFLLNGRPTTSTVNLTQDIGRVLEPKTGEMILVDYFDDSVKRQITVFDILELQRVSQGELVGANEGRESEAPQRDTYMRGLFRPSLVAAFEAFDNRLVSDLDYKPEPEQLSPYELARQAFEAAQTKEFARLQRFWERKLSKDGLAPGMPDHFMAADKSLLKEQISEHEYSIDIQSPRNIRLTGSDWPGLIHGPAIVPPVSVDPADLNAYIPRVSTEMTDPAELIANSQQLMREAIDKAIDFRVSDRDAAVIRYRYGLDDGIAKSNEETASHFGVSALRIAQMIRRGLEALGNPLAKDSHGLAEFVRDQEIQIRFKLQDLPKKDNQENRPKIIAERDELFAAITEMVDNANEQFKSDFRFEYLLEIVKKVGLVYRIGTYDYPKQLTMLRKLALINSDLLLYTMHTRRELVHTWGIDERDAAEIRYQEALDELAFEVR